MTALLDPITGLARDADTGALITRGEEAGDVVASYGRAIIDTSDSSPAGVEVIPAQPGQRIAVLGAILLAAEAIDIQFWSGPVSDDDRVSPAFPVADRGGFALPAVPSSGMAWMLTEVGEPLMLTLSAGQQVSGILLYTLVT